VHKSAVRVPPFCPPKTPANAGFFVKRPCLDCGVVIKTGSFCVACKKKREQKRGSSAKRGYDSAWARKSKNLTRKVGFCENCGDAPTPENPLTLDHVTPKSLGGSNDDENLAVLCRRCNSKKHTKRNL